PSTQLHLSHPVAPCNAPSAVAALARGQSFRGSDALVAQRSEQLHLTGRLRCRPALLTSLIVSLFSPVEVFSFVVKRAVPCLGCPGRFDCPKQTKCRWQNGDIWTIEL